MSVKLLLLPKHLNFAIFEIHLYDIMVKIGIIVILTVKVQENG
jgi:NADH:ubiquinone oxidoreductase subunit K